ncbi:MAG: FAD-binding and (Fe-S)-binding domain-containing protein [Phycisphaerales bacterium JB050]
MHRASAQLGLADDLIREKHTSALAAKIRGEVRFGTHDRMLYATDASIYQVEPLGVVIPADVEDLRAIVAYCSEHDLPMLPRGGGTSLAGQCVNRAVVIDCSANCRDILEVNEAEHRCRVQPGITIDDLNSAISETGLFFAPDPSTSKQANIGGCIGNNAAGTRSIKYGRTSESVEAVEALLASGETVTLGPGDPASTRTGKARRIAAGLVEICDRHANLIRERFPKTKRRNAGYALDMILAEIERAREAGHDPVDTINLAPIICGAEGTLALVTEATLTLHPKPKAKGLAVIGFENLDAAIECVESILTLEPAAVELLDDLIVSLARTNIEYRDYVQLMPQPKSGELLAVLYVEFFSQTGTDEIESKFEALERLIAGLPQAANANLSRYTDPSAMDKALKLRKAGEPLLHAIPGNRKPLGFVEDNAVPVANLAEFVRRFRTIVEEHDTRAAFWAHASVGVLHVRPLLDPRDAEDRKRMEAIATSVADLAKELGGVMSGEHGDGRVRGPLLERYFGPELMDAFRQVKALFDPKGLLNPGNIVDPQPIETIHETLRTRPHGENLSFKPVDTFFDYTAEHGFDHAVELCNGAGVCRKKQGGTMCPSYRATLDERHSTRGRGNALRLAISGQLGTNGEPAWGDKETLETLNLCLSCKACKTECPSNVDIAQYKAEYLAQSHKSAGRVPFRNRVFGHVRALNRIGSAFAPISNWVANSKLHRALINPTLGLARQRTLPAFGKSLHSQLKRPEHAINAGLTHDAPTVLLYADCFTTYNDPEIGLAAAKVLNAFGYRVELPKVGCCGRAPVSTGLLHTARNCASSASQVLASAWDRATNPVAILACEPSCLSTITDEWQKFAGLKNESLALAAQRSMLVEQFLDANWDQHPQRPTFHRPSGKVAVHAHCHQKALWGAQTTANFIRRLAGADKTIVLDTGCCGMAGSFGYTADRYDLSMRIGELDLFPKVRALDPDDTLIAPGTSCRHQVHDGTARQALHPLQYAAQMLRP